MRMMDRDDSMNYEQYVNWDNMTEEFEKVNAIVSASSNAGYWVQSMDELVSYTSNEYTSSSSRRGLVEDADALKDVVNTMSIAHVTVYWITVALMYSGSNVMGQGMMPSVVEINSNLFGFHSFMYYILSFCDRFLSCNG